MNASPSNPSREESLQLAFKRLLRLNLFALIAWGVGAAVVASGFLLPYSNGIFSSGTIGLVYLLSLPITFRFWRTSKAIAASPDVATQLETYDKLRSSQSALNVFVTVGAIAMIPGAIILLQIIPVGWAILFNLYAGAIIGLRLKSVHQSVSYYRQGISADLASDSVVLNPYISNPYKSGTDVLPPGAKRPLAQGVVWVGGLLLLGINLMIELSVFATIRSHGMQNGVIRDLSSQMLFALSQVFDVIVLSVFGLILLILALINQLRVADKRKNLAAIAIVVAGLVIFPGGMSTVLAGVAGPSDSLVKIQTEGRQSTETLRAILAAGPISGFEGSYEEFYDCEIDGCSDSVLYLAKEVGPESMAGEYCAAVVQFGAEVGMATWAVAPDYTPQQLTGNLEPAIAACIKQIDSIVVATVQQYQTHSEAFVMAGTATVGAQAPVNFTLTQSIDGNLDDNPGFRTYFLHIGTTYRIEPFAQPGDGLSQGTIEINDLLNLIGQQRLANPERAPMDRAFLEEVLTDYPHDVELALVENSSGEIHRIELKTSDGVELCLSIEPWESDPFNEGTPDPGMGYALGTMESLEVLRGFGNSVVGACG